MKTIDLFCASPASTAICTSMDQRAMVHHGTRPIERHNRHTGDQRKTRNPIPGASQLPVDPKINYQKGRKSCGKQSEVRRRSSADIPDLSSSPAGSSRYLLSDTPFINLGSNIENNTSSALVPSQTVTMRTRGLGSTESLVLRSSSTSSNAFSRSKSLSTHSTDFSFKKSSSISSNGSSMVKSSSAGSRPCEQVVELRVSIHCKGCEGKVRKHISRMEGVTSFSIDLATKKVIVIGDVTPLGVLTSISRVKNAQFWPSPASSSPSSAPPTVGVRF